MYIDSQSLLCSTRCQILLIHDNAVKIRDAIGSNFNNELILLIFSYGDYEITHYHEKLLGTRVANRWAELEASNSNLFYQAALSTALFQFAMYGVKFPCTLQYRELFLEGQKRIAGLFPKKYMDTMISPLDLPRFATRELDLGPFDPYQPQVWGGSGNVWSCPDRCVSVFEGKFWEIYMSPSILRMNTKQLFLAPFRNKGTGRIFCPLVLYNLFASRCVKEALSYETSVSTDTLCSICILNDTKAHQSDNDHALVFLPIAREIVGSLSFVESDLVDWVLECNTLYKNRFNYIRFRDPEIYRDRRIFLGCSIS